MKRVVITGMGIVSPLGAGLDHNWSSLMAGQNGFRRIDTFDVDDLPCQIAADVPRVGTDGTFKASMRFMD